jgi:hypothetical protein
MEYDPKDFLAAEITKTDVRQETGLKLTEQEGKYLISQVDGVFKMFTEVEPGYQLIKLQDKDVKDYKSLDEINKVLDGDLKISVQVLKRKDFYDVVNEPSQSSNHEDTDFLEAGIPEER